MNINHFDKNHKFKLKSFYRKTIHNDFFMYPHSHEYLEIMNIISGTAIIDVYEKDKVVKSEKLGPNSLIVISSSQFHRIRTSDDCTIQNLEFEISLNQGQLFVDTLGYLKQSKDFQKIINEKYGIAIFSDTNDILNTIYHIILRSEKVGLTYNDVHLDCAIFHFFIKLCEAYNASNIAKDSQTFYITKAIAIINQNILTEISVKEIAKSLGVSVSYLERIFKHSTHLTVKKYIELLKLDFVKESLINSNDSIDEIAKKYGFENCAKLNYQFKKVYNMTPRSYRKNNYKKEIFGIDEKYTAKILGD